MTRTMRRTARMRCVAGALAGSTLWLVGGQGAQAQARPPGEGMVAGVVRDLAGNEIASAEVGVAGTRLRARTDVHGAFLLRDLQAGTTTLLVRRIGFKPLTLPVTVATGFSDPLDVVLDPVPQRLGAVFVHATRRAYVGRMADFHRRRDAGAGGYFITRDQIDAQRPYRTTDLLRKVPGVGLLLAGGSRNEVRMRGMRCPPLVWMDGMPLTSGYFDPDNVDPRTIDGMEIYGGLASVPPALMGPRSLGSCGVIAIWSRTHDRREGRRKERAGKADLAALVDSLEVYTADQVAVAAQPDPSQPLAPPYPDELRQRRTPGLVIVEFVVDTTGQVERNTIGVVSSSHRLFAAAVESAIPEVPFTPAVLDGRRVRQVVQLPVRFVVDEVPAPPAAADSASPPPPPR